jgi:hypothetical protein
MEWRSSRNGSDGRHYLCKTDIEDYAARLAREATKLVSTSTSMARSEVSYLTLLFPHELTDPTQACECTFDSSDLPASSDHGDDFNWDRDTF